MPSITYQQLKQIDRDDGLEEVSRENHGRNDWEVTYKLDWEGKPYLVTCTEWPGQGIEDQGWAYELRPAVAVTKTVHTWEDAK